MKTSKKYSNEIIDCGCYVSAGELQRRKGEEQASSGLKELSQDAVITKKSSHQETHYGQGSGGRG